MPSVRRPVLALAVFAALASGGASAQSVIIRGTFNGIPYAPTCAPPSTDPIVFGLTPSPVRVQASFACDSGTPSRPLRISCLPLDIGGLGVLASYQIRAVTGASELLLECPTDATTTFQNLDVAISDLFVDRALYQANPGADTPASSCLFAGGGTTTAASYDPVTRIFRYTCQNGTSTTSVACFTYTGVQVSLPEASSGFVYPLNNGTLQVDDCIGFGPTNNQALNSPALIPAAGGGGGDLLLLDGFEPPAAVDTAITITGIVPSPAVIGEPYTVSVAAVAGAGGTEPARGAVLVSDDAGANCRIDLSGSGLGSCPLTTGVAGTRSIRATYVGRLGFNGSTNTLALTVGQGTQTINFTSPAANANIAYSPSGNVALVATGGNSGNPVTFSSSTPAVCTTSGSNAVIVTVGTCTVTANQAGNSNYTSAPPVVRSFNIVKAPQVITFPDPGPQPFGSTFTVSATGGASGNPVVFSSTNNARCTVSGNVVTPVAVNVCTIRAQQAGNANYDAATPVLRDITITRGPGSLVFPAQADRSLAAGAFGLSFTPGPSTGQVTFVSLTPNICTISASTVTPIATGVCTVSGTHEEDAFYTASPTIDRDINIVP
jgi:hypothetical protein